MKENFIMLIGLVCLLVFSFLEIGVDIKNCVTYEIEHGVVLEVEADNE